MKHDPPETPIGQILKRDGLPDTAFVDLGSQVSGVLCKQWSKANPFDSGSGIHSLWLQPILSGSATAAASLAAGNVFLATAHRATLMTIGAGVGSAVIGPGGIVAHAPFVAAGSVLFPVVAPLMAFVTLSSMLTSTSLHRVERELREISRSIQRIKDLMETDDWAKLIVADEDLRDIGFYLENDPAITDYVKIACRDTHKTLRRLRQKYGRLVNKEVNSIGESYDRMADTTLFALSSLLDVEADLICLHLTCQTTPALRERQQGKLQNKIKKTQEAFRTLCQPLMGRVVALENKLPKNYRFNTRPSVRRLKKEKDDINRFFNSSLLYAIEPSNNSIFIFQDGEGALKAHKMYNMKLLKAA